MSKTQRSIENANAQYARDFASRATLPAKPAKNAAILTCMDHRLDPANFAGLAQGDAHVIRNAGGRASDDAIRSLIISHKLMGTSDWFVVQHTRCAMCTFSGHDMGELLAASLEPAQMADGMWHNMTSPGGSGEGRYMNWLTMGNVFDSVRNDVMRIASHPLVSERISIFGYVFDVDDGVLRRVDGAVRRGSGDSAAN